MDIQDFLNRRGGAARTSTLLSAGFSRSSIDAALKGGRMRRLRRGLYGLPGEMGQPANAMHTNALLTCLSAAPAYGLWTVRPASGLHLSAGHKAVAGIRHGPCRHPAHPYLPVAGLADVLLHA